MNRPLLIAINCLTLDYSELLNIATVTLNIIYEDMSLPDYTSWLAQMQDEADSLMEVEMKQ